MNYDFKSFGLMHVDKAHTAYPPQALLGGGHDHVLGALIKLIFRGRRLNSCHRERPRGN
jgi:hypothetical protein